MIARARILLTTDAVGGVWTYTLDLAGALRSSGACVKVVVLGPGPDADQIADAARRGLDVSTVDHPLEWLAENAAEVRTAGAAIAAMAAGWEADLVHLHAPALAAGAPFRCPVVVVHHSCSATWRRAMKLDEPTRGEAWQMDLTREGLRRATMVLVPTDAHGVLVKEVYGLPVAPRTVRNGRAGDVAPAAGGVDEIFASGRLWDAGKNIAALDRVAASLAWPVRVAGPRVGPDGKAVAFAAIDTLGPLSGAMVRRYLARRPIFVAPARFEPFGLGVLEAAQAGCALVLNDIATFREVWEGAALLVDADDARALGAAIGSLMADGGRRQAYGRAALERSGRYTLDAMARGTIAAYETCLGASAVPRAAVPA